MNATKSKASEIRGIATVVLPGLNVPAIGSTVHLDPFRGQTGYGADEIQAVRMSGY
ncbi:hypothetical protein ACWDSF_03325 [Nocardia beijingensis]